MTKRLLLLFIVVLFLSGLTAIPIDAELSLLVQRLSNDSLLYSWLQKVRLAYQQVNRLHPFLLYGYDWLAFAHFVLAILFIGPYRHPARNIWVIEFGLIACVLVVPFALIAGHFRSIPLGWRFIDGSFGVIGFILLWICYAQTRKAIVRHKHSLQNLQP